jgi:hypothetical protein
MRRETCRRRFRRGGVLAVFLGGRAATAHWAARGWNLGPDGGGALCRSDCSPTRRLDGGAGQGLVLLNCVNATARSFLVRAFYRACWVIPKNSSKLKENRALPLKRGETQENPKYQNTSLTPDGAPYDIVCSAATKYLSRWN